MQSAKTPSSDQHTDWLRIAICFVAGMLAVSHNGKLPGAIPALQDQLGFSLTAAGVLVSAFSFVAAGCGIFISRTLRQFPFWLVAMSGLMLSGTASIIATFFDDFLVLTLMRTLEGLGFMFCIVSLPALIQAQASPKDRNLAMAIWSCFVPAGLGLTMILVAPLQLGQGWVLIWQVIGLLSVVCGLVMVLAFRIVAPARIEISNMAMHSKPASSGLWKDLTRHKDIWVVFLIFLPFSVSFQPVMAFLPSLLIDTTGFGLGSAASLTGFIILLNIAGNLLAARILRRGMTPQNLMRIAMLVNMICASMVFIAELPVWLQIASGMVFSAISGLLPGVAWIAIGLFSENRQQSSVYSAALIQTAGIGQLLGPVALAGFVDFSGSWSYAALPIALAGLFGLYCVKALGRDGQSRLTRPLAY